MERSKVLTKTGKEIGQKQPFRDSQMSYFLNVLRLFRRSVRITGLAACAIAIAFFLSLAPASSAIASPHILQLASEPASFVPANTIDEESAYSANRSAKTLFTANCAGCHAGGGNVIRRGKTLKQKALKRYGYEDVGAIAQIITHGKGIMSGYEDRLTGEEISAIAQYVKAQSESDWK